MKVAGLRSFSIAGFVAGRDGNYCGDEVGVPGAGSEG
jgi:hypothetical protein